MLSSITPLGQRGRGMSWRRTVAAFWVSAVAVGAVVFGAVGALGSLLALDRGGLWLAVAAIGAAGALDLAGVEVPGTRRQVDEDWLGRYRDWVVGLGYGAQLGAGVATIVTSFGTWALFVVASMVGAETAALIGIAFGMGRSLLLVRTRSIGSPSSLAEMMRRFASDEVWARRASLAACAGVVLVMSAHVF